MKLGPIGRATLAQIKARESQDPVAIKKADEQFKAAVGRPTQTDPSEPFDEEDQS